jgi:C-methyltransferase C-terminal domain
MAARCGCMSARPAPNRSHQPPSPLWCGRRRPQRGYASSPATARPFATKCTLLEFLIGAKRAGQRVAGYGAPAKGNRLLNYCGIGPEFIDFTVDRNPHKQNHLLPGSRIPIRDPQAIVEAKPDFVFILPWNLREEIIGQMDHIRRWRGRFVVAIPQLEIIE